MTREQFLLEYLSQECAELSQAASKAILFGLDSYNPHTGISNLEQLKAEFIDVLTVMDKMEHEGMIHVELNEMTDGIEAKSKKIEKFYKICQEIGRVEHIQSKQKDE